VQDGFRTSYFAPPLERANLLLAHSGSSGGAKNARPENAELENGGTAKLWKAVAVENVQHS